MWKPEIKYRSEGISPAGELNSLRGYQQGRTVRTAKQPDCYADRSRAAEVGPTQSGTRCAGVIRDVNLFLRGQRQRKNVGVLTFREMLQ
jgi:hypothetical protein